jgi:hypothetical protein
VHAELESALIERRQRRRFGHIPHHAAGNTGGAEPSLPLRGRRFGEQLLELVVHGRGVLPTQIRRAKTHIAQPLRAADFASERFELRLLHDAEGDLPTVLRGEEAGCRLAAVTDVACAFGRLAGHEIRHDRRGHERDARVEHRDIDVLAASFALTTQQRRQDRERGRLSGKGIDHGKTNARRTVARRAAQGHHAARCLHDVVDRRPIAPRSALAVPRYRTIDETGTQLAHGRIVEPELRHRSGPKVLDDDVARCDQASGRFLSERLLQIERDRFLAGIDTDERGRHAVVTAVSAVRAHGIAAAWRFHFDHLCTQQAEQVSRERACHHMAEISDSNPFKR